MRIRDAENLEPLVKKLSGLNMKNINRYFMVSIILSFFLFSELGYAEGIVLEGTRVIYKSGTKTKTIKVKNTDKETTFLVQNWVETGSGDRTSDFILTPPVFKSVPDSDNLLRLRYAGGVGLPENKESIFYLNVKSIPSIDKSAISDRNVMVLAVKTRLKLIYRPAKVPDYKDSQIPELLKFYNNNNHLYAENSTPYYITLTNITSNNVKIKDIMLRPYDSMKIRDNLISKEISFSFINDFGTLVGVKHKNVERK